MSDLGIGIIGCGNISAAYLRLAPMFKGIEMRAVADINMDAANARAQEFGVRAETVEGLLASDDIDIVVNLTIPAAHVDVSSRILEAGKHVYSEKPFVLTLEEGSAIKALADSKGLRVGSAPDTFMGGAHQQARAIIDDGTLGEVTSGTAFVMGHGMEDWHPNPDFFFLPGAGPILDLGPYYITNLVQLIGPIKKVAAFTSTPAKMRTIGNGAREGEQVPVKTPTTIHGILEFENGAVVSLGASWDIWGHGHTPMELYGEKATLDVPDPNFFGGELTLTPAREEAAVVTPWEHPFGVENEDGRANYRTAGLADMAVAISEGRAHRCSMDMALHAVEVMGAFLASGESGQVIEMTTTCARPDALGPSEAAALLR